MVHTALKNYRQQIYGTGVRLTTGTGSIRDQDNSLFLKLADNANFPQPVSPCACDRLPAAFVQVICIASRRE
jgi:hypothetical protein